MYQKDGMKQILYLEKVQGLKVERAFRGEGYTMPIKHFHREYELYYLVKGARYYFIEDRSYYVEAGSLVFIGKEQIHRTSSAGSASHERILVELEESWLDSFFRVFPYCSMEQFFQSCRICSIAESERPAAESLLNAVASEASSHRVGSRQMIEACLCQLLVLAFRSRGDGREQGLHLGIGQEKHQKVQQVARYLQENYAEQVSLELLSKKFFISSSYLSRNFKEVTGLTVGEYLTLQRIRQSRRLLESGEHTVTRIAELVGYDSITYFERVFKKYTGRSPLHYRRRYGSEQPQ